MGENYLCEHCEDVGLIPCQFCEGSGKYYVKDSNARWCVGGNCPHCEGEGVEDCPSCS